MYQCPICMRRHYRGSAPAMWCLSVDNPDYVAHLTMRHRQGFHGKGTGGHKDCPSCRIKPEQLQLNLQMFVPVIKPEQPADICGCQG